MSLLFDFMSWLETTSLSVAFHESIWSFPIVESVHVLGLCLFLGMAVLTDLRLIGLSFRRVPVSDVMARLLPWTWVGAIIMVASGTVLFLNTPVRYYTNIFLRVKFVMLFLAVINAWVFHSGIFRRVAKWDRELPTPKYARFAGAVSLVLWGGVVVAGRMIAYNWFDKR
jgi:hypothetical protein